MLTMPSSGQYREPDDRDRPEQRADHLRAFLLKQKQSNQDDDRNGNDERLNAGVATSRPSTADSTEIAGVIMPSP